jgi:hypothetical protein
MTELLTDSSAVITGLLGAIAFLTSSLLATFVWLGRRKVQRLDDIANEVARDVVRKTELASMQSAMSAERERLHAENSERLERIEGTVTATHASLIDLGVMNHRITTAEQRIQELRDFKHEHCEPATRYIDYLKNEKPWERE